MKKKRSLFERLTGSVILDDETEEVEEHDHRQVLQQRGEGAIALRIDLEVDVLRQDGRRQFVLRGFAARKSLSQIEQPGWAKQAADMNGAKRWRWRHFQTPGLVTLP